jgi:hypothetical protein
MYVTGASGLRVYDVTQPQSPRRLGALALPHFENEASTRVAWAAATSW